MKGKLAIGLLAVAAILAWAGMVGAQTAPPAPKVELPSGEAVWRLEGLWEAVCENYGGLAQHGTYPNVFSVKQSGNAVSGTRMKDNPPPAPGRAGSPSLFGELEKSGFKYIYLIDGTGKPHPSTGRISENGKKILIDNGRDARITLTRP